MDGWMHCKRTGDKKNSKLGANMGESGWGVTKIGRVHVCRPGGVFEGTGSFMCQCTCVFLCVLCAQAAHLPPHSPVLTLPAASLLHH